MRRTVELNQDWEVTALAPRASLAPGTLSETAGRVAGRELGWLPACLPAQVHEILVSQGVIEDPARLGKARDCVWVAEQDWVYRRRFTVEAPEGRIYLHFLGLDTLVDVYLNDELLARHDDMYLPLRVEITPHLQDENFLTLHFHSPHRYLDACELPPAWQGRVARHKLLRKSQPDFTDYLGAKPYLTCIGVYDRVLLEIVDQVELRDVDVRPRLEDKGRVGTVAVSVQGAALGSGASIELRCELEDPLGAVVDERSVVADRRGQEDWRGTLELSVDTPALWWPRGHGDHALYRVRVSVLTGGEVRDHCVRPIGFRDVQMPRPLEFVVNGREVKLWGAQMVQLRGITHCWDGDTARRLLDLAEHCNMNAIRVWGSADRFDDEFYCEADRRGLLVWQEFFHDYGMYPDTPEYRALCRREAEYQVKRLKHHPSLLMWCGGNEAFMGADFDHPAEPYIGGEIFTDDYATICRELDPDRYYHLNSPSGGDYANDPLAGDTHSYTNTWFVPGAEHPVLISEEVRTSPPSLKSLLRYFDSSDPWPAEYSGMLTSDQEYPWPTTWNERTSTFAWKKIPPVEQFYDAADLESMVHRFGAAHGQYLRRVLESNRRGKTSADPDGRRSCLGHFVYRWNDPWPIIYGSMLDYYLEPYIPYYAIRRAFEPVLLSFDIGDFIYLWLTNDRPDPVSGSVLVRLFDPHENEFVHKGFVGELRRPVAVGPGNSKIVADLREFKQFPRSWILVAEFVDPDGRTVARTNDFVDIERHLRFPDARLQLAREGDVLSVSTDRFARCVELSGADATGGEFGWLFEDNYFDLLPGEAKQVRIVQGHETGVITAKGRYSSTRASVAVS